MTKSSDEIIAENRQDIKQTAANFIEVGDRGSIDISFGNNIVEISVSTVEVYKRNLNSTFIPGHPNGSDHGPGRGDVGDQRGGWTLVTDSPNSVEFTRDGRQAVRDALDGQTGGVREAGVGNGTADATTGDTALGSLSATVNGAATKPSGSPEVARGIGVFLFNDHENSATEFGLYNTDGSLMARVTVNDVNPTAEEEVRVIIHLSVTGSGVGDTVVTNEGEEAIANAIAFPKTAVGLNKIAFGSGSSTFSKSSSSLTTEEIRRIVSRDLSLESIRAEAKIFENEPASQPVTISEMAVFDNSSTPNMVWASTFSGNEKTDGVPMTGSVGFRIE